jgi:hypothetical protein
LDNGGAVHCSEILPLRVRVTLGEMSNTILPTASDLFDILQSRARERHRHRRGSLKVLDPEWPIRVP